MKIYSLPLPVLTELVIFFTVLKQNMETQAKKTGFGAIWIGAILLATGFVYAVVVQFIPGLSLDPRAQITLSLSFFVFCVIAVIISELAKKQLGLKNPGSGL